MKNWIDNYWLWLNTHRLLVSSLLLITTLLLVSQLIHFTVNPTPYFLDKSHPSRIADIKTKSAFTNTGEFAFIAIETESESIFNPDSLQTIADLSIAFESLTLLTAKHSEQLSGLSFDKTSQDAIDQILDNGITPSDQFRLRQLHGYYVTHKQFDQANIIKDIMIRLQPIKKVRSIATMDDLSVYEEEGEQILDSFALMESVPNDKASASIIEKKVRDNPIYADLLINNPSKGAITATSIQIELAIAEDDSPKMIAIYHAIDKILKQTVSNDRFHIGGPPMVTAQTAYEMESNNQKLMPYVLLIVFFILFLSFRSLQGVLIPLTIAVVTTLWTLSVMAMLRIPQNIITTALPVFLVSIAVADAIHFLSAYYSERQTSNKETAIQHSLKHLFSPLFITSLTTMVGFIAVSNTKIIFMKEFGLFVALGIGFAFFLTLTLLPIMLMFFDKNTDQAVSMKNAKGANAIGNVAIYCLGFIERHRLGVIMAFICLFVIAALGLIQLKIDNQVISNFSEDAPIRVDNEVINKHFGGTIPFSIVLTAKTENTFKDPNLLKAIDSLSNQLAALETVGYTYSLVDLVKRSYQQQDNAAFVLPPNASNAMIAQYLFTYENAEQQEIRDIVNLSYDTTRILVTLNKDQSSEIDKVLSEVNRLAPLLFPDTIDYQITGFGELLSISTQEIVINQFDNNFIALGVIFLIMLILLRSIPLAIIAMMPLVCTVYFIFSLMGAVGIPLDIGTALVSCITFGIGIDYAIHFIVILKRECLQSTSTLSQALAMTMKQVASPIIINSSSLAAGLLVMITAGYKPIINLGLIIASAMVICALITLILLPLLVLVVKPKALQKGLTPKSPSLA